MPSGTNTATGEIHDDAADIDVPAVTTSPAMEHWLSASNDRPLGSLDIDPEMTARLTAPFDDDEWDILPTGEVYVGHMKYRQRLTEVFGPGGWTIRPVTPIVMNEHNAAHQRWEMWIRGVWFATCVGSSRYGGGDNSRFDYADMAESIKSNALTRMCKDIPMGADLYDRAKIAAWKAAYATQEGNRWRRNDAPRPGQVHRAAPAPRVPEQRVPDQHHAVDESFPSENDEQDQQEHSAPPARARRAPAARPAATRPAATRPAAAPAPARAPQAAPRGGGDSGEYAGTVRDIRELTSGNNARGPWTLYGIEVNTADGASLTFKLASWSDNAETMLDELRSAMDTEARLIFAATAQTRGRFTDLMLTGIELDADV